MLSWKRVLLLSPNEKTTSENVEQQMPSTFRITFSTGSNSIDAEPEIVSAVACDS